MCNKIFDDTPYIINKPNHKLLEKEKFFPTNADLDYCLVGLPKHSVIAINSTGLRHNEESKQIWIDGYKQVVEKLEPIQILRYGAKQNGENEDISRYYSNDNRLVIEERRCSYGR